VTVSGFDSRDGSEMRVGPDVWPSALVSPCVTVIAFVRLLVASTDDRFAMFPVKSGHPFAAFSDTNRGILRQNDQNERTRSEWRLRVTVESFIKGLLGPNLPIRIRAYDGTDVGPKGAATTVTLRSHDALIRMVTAPGELGIARAYVAGDIDIDGNIYDVLELRRLLPEVKLTPRQIRELVQLIGIGKIRRILPPPEEHRRSRGRLHTRDRDSDAISHHYDVSNEFYRMVLGPSMTYSCAVFQDAQDTLERAQANKYELICQKLGLQPGMRLLDIGCGWGGMVLHAAEHHGVEAVGVTISQNQVDLARKRVAEAGLTGRIDIRLQDYRDVKDRPFDAISSIGMFEHVGMERLGTYFDQVARLLVPGGRVVNHAIGLAGPARRPRLARTGFLDRYVFPDGELHEVPGSIPNRSTTGLP